MATYNTLDTTNPSLARFGLLAVGGSIAFALIGGLVEVPTLIPSGPTPNLPQFMSSLLASMRSGG